jgi:hypothetical protein
MSDFKSEYDKGYIAGVDKAIELTHLLFSRTFDSEALAALTELQAKLQAARTPRLAF